MKYTKEFKVEVFNTLRFTGSALPCLEAIKKNKHNVVRYILEDVLDDDSLYLPKNETNGKRVVREDKINTYEKRVEIYSTFMDMYTKYLDNVESRVFQEK